MTKISENWTVEDQRKSNRESYHRHRNQRLAYNNAYCRQRYEEDAEYREHKIEASSKWYRKNRNRFNKRQNLRRWLRGGRFGKGLGFLKGTGICMICEEINPFALENHHIFGKGSDIISLCAICHHMLHNSAPRELLLERLLSNGEQKK